MSRGAARASPSGPAGLPAGTTAHHQPCPGARTGFVFICPGRFEQARGLPCAAGTGANLMRALAVLHVRRPDLFPTADRFSYVVTNSWDSVEFPNLTGRSVPTETEVLQPGNLRRLAEEVAQLEVVVACGAQAHVAMRALLESGASRARLATARHLSQRSVNMITGGSDTAGRIAAWCDGVLAQLALLPGKA